MVFCVRIKKKNYTERLYKMSSVKVSKTSKKVSKKTEEVTEAPAPVVETPAPVVEATPAAEVPSAAAETAPEALVETVRTRLEKMLHDLEEEKKSLVERITYLKASIKMYDTERKAKGEKRKVKRVLDPNRPVNKNGIAKPQVISEDLATFLFKHFKVPKGTLVSRTGALSKENGLSKYITDKGLRKDGEIHPDAELVKLLGQPSDLSKDGKTKVYYHKTVMKLIGKHFPASKSAAK